jgi:hypothetical protein
MKKNVIILFAGITLLLMMAALAKPCLAQGKAILVVGDSSSHDMSLREDALKKYLAHYRQKSGHNSSTLPILVYDFSNAQARRYCQDKLGIAKGDLLFLGIVQVRQQVPLKVLFKVTNPKDLERNASSLISRLAGGGGEAPGSGLQVATTPPGAKVFLGSKFVGFTPLTLKSVAPGQYTLTFVKDGFAKTRREVSVERGKPARIDAKLSKKGQVLSISSNPTGAKVYIDGVEYGLTPLSLTSLSPGEHRIIMKHQGRQWEGKADVLADQTLEINHDFDGKKPAADPTPAPSPTVADTPPTDTQVREAFVPRSQQGSVFRLTVTNMEEVESIKDHYKPKPGYKFVVVYLTQQNISGELQIYSGKISLIDNSSSSYDYLENLSNFWLVVLRPGGMITGYQVFEVPADAKPMQVVLHGLNTAPMSVSLQ